MNINKLQSILKKYCRVRRGKHFVCYPPNTDKVITVSTTSSDRLFHKSVYNDFKKVGIRIKEFE